MQDANTTTTARRAGELPPPIGTGKHALFRGAATKDGVTISVHVNRNDWGTQGSFDLEK